MAPTPRLLLQLPHEVLVDLFVRLEVPALGHLAATCRLLQYGQSSPQTPNPVEDALRLRAKLLGWSRTLPVDSRRAVKYLLRLAWQDHLEFNSISAGRWHPVSFFVDSGGSLRACGVELTGNEDVEAFFNDSRAAPAGILGFGPAWCMESGFDYSRKEAPTTVPATEGVRMRGVAIGETLGLALTDKGQVYMWGFTSHTSRAPKIPAPFQEISQVRMRRVATCAFLSAALTDEGELYTWWDEGVNLRDHGSSAAGAGYPLPGLNELNGASYRPRRVEGALSGKRIVSVAARFGFTIVASDEGAALHPRSCATTPGALKR
jgi:alpha-tubulin suppressor-like RCC1 family protein